LNLKVVVRVLIPAEIYLEGYQAPQKFIYIEWYQTPQKFIHRGLINTLRRFFEGFDAGQKFVKLGLVPCQVFSKFALWKETQREVRQH
jgi:hypothetical protein